LRGDGEFQPHNRMTAHFDVLADFYVGRGEAADVPAAARARNPAAESILTGGGRAWWVYQSRLYALPRMMMNPHTTARSSHPRILASSSPTPRCYSRSQVILSSAFATRKASWSSTYRLLVNCLSTSGAVKLFIVALANCLATSSTCVKSLVFSETRL
jgi:hypothetical protein